MVMKIIRALYFIIICFYVIVGNWVGVMGKKGDRLPCFDTLSLLCGNYLAKELR